MNGKGALAALVLAVLACEEAPPSGAAPAPSFREASDRALAEAFVLFPELGVYLGDHSGDGKLSYPDAQHTAAAIAWAKATETAMAAFDSAALTPTERVERDSWLLETRGVVFSLETRRASARDPISYTNAFDVAPYIAKNYAPLAQRARALAAHADAGVRVLALAEQQLEPVLPRAPLEVALNIARGAAPFLRDELPLALAELAEPERAEALAAAERLALAGERYVAFLEARLPAADASFALGEAELLRMLRETQGVTMTVAEIDALCSAEIERDRAALALAAGQIDAKRDVEAVVREVLADKPAASEVIDVAREATELLRKRVVEREIATIPAPDPLLVMPSPAYMRSGFAFLSAGGPLEPSAVESHYYITPPDPAWTPEQQRDAIMARTVLLDVSAHEAFPGHFLHAVWSRQIPERTRRALAGLGSIVTVEGWGLYAEEIAWEAGDRDPRARVAQIEEALLRGARCKSSLGLHTRGWSVEDATRAFQEIAHQAEVVAREEALRGTYDAMYLGYTLGKAKIRALREELRARAEAEGRAFSARAFHDEFMSYGGAPLPAIREAMLQSVARGAAR